MLSQKQVEQVCLPDHGNLACRYLDMDYNNLGICYFCKKKTLSKVAIDEEVAEADPNNEDIPIGDNCQGYLPMRNLLQGFDIP